MTLLLTGGLRDQGIVPNRYFARGVPKRKNGAMLGIMLPTPIVWLSYV
jgi:hypothetical protein